MALLIEPEIYTFAANGRLTQGIINGWPADILAGYTQTLGGFRTTRPMAQVAMSTTFGVANGNDVVMPFTSVVVDTDGMASTLAPNQLTVQTPGWFRIILQLHWDTTGAGQRACKIMTNGSNPNLNAIASDSRAPGVDGIGSITACEAFAHLNYGSTIYANAYQLSGVTLDLVPNNGGSFMSAEWIAP